MKKEKFAIALQISFSVLLFLCLLVNIEKANAQLVTTFSGKGLSDDGTGSAATFQGPSGVAIDASGNLYIADYGNHKIRKITPAGVVSTFAGSGTAGSTDGTGTGASFNNPSGIAIDASGNLYVADRTNHKIRKITAAGIVTTFAGFGTAGSTDATGIAASFSSPTSIAIDVSDNLYVADAGNNKIRKITSGGVVTTFAGSGSTGAVDATGTAASFNGPTGVAIDASGNLYVADFINNKIRKITTGGVVTTFAGSGTLGSTDATGTAASFRNPHGVTVDLTGNVYVADLGNYKIRMISPVGVVNTLAGSGTTGFIDATGTAARFAGPTGVAVDASGNVYVADNNNNRIRKVTSGGVVTTFAGSAAVGSTDGSVSIATFNSPIGTAVDASGNVYVADYNNHKIRQITPAGVVSTLAGSGVSGSTDATGSAARFSNPTGVAVDASGNVYVADFNNHKIRKITPGGVVTTFAGSGTSGSLDATGTAASFNFPLGVTVDAAGNVYVADLGNSKIRKITPAGVVTTLAGSGAIGSIDATGVGATFNNPTGVAVDASGNVYVADWGNHKIRKITSGGVVTTLAGSGTIGSTDATGTSASFNSPYGIAVDISGTIYVADRANHKIRKITPAGVVTTLAGSGSVGSKDAMGTAASFNEPTGVALYNSGDLYVTDMTNNKIRKITAVSEIKISQSATELVSGVGSYNFGTINALSSSSAVTFTIENVVPTEKVLLLTGTPKVTLSGADAASFSVNLTSTTASVAVGATTTFTITFTPTSSGSKSATVTVLNDDLDESTYTFTITGSGVKINQSISGLSNISKTYGAAAFTLSGASNSSLTLSYISSNTSVATVAGNTVTIHAVGSTTITASQSGDATYNPATDVNVTLTVAQAPLTITADDKTKMEGVANPTLTVSYSGLVYGETESVLGCSVTPQTTANTSSAIGSYPITISNCGYTNSNYSYTFVNGSLEVTINTATNGPEDEQMFTLYPNPTNDLVFISANSDMQLTVYNAQGVKVMELEVNNGDNLISLENLNAGLYIIRCTDGDHQQMEYRIIKN